MKRRLRRAHVGARIVKLCRLTGTMLSYLFVMLTIAPAPGWADGPRAKGPPAGAEGPEIHLTLADAVALGLRENRTIRGAYLQRVVDKFNLRVAEDQFTPHAQLGGSLGFNRTTSAMALASLTPSVVSVTPIGTQLAFSWDNQQNGTGSSTLNLTVLQPLLKGAGYDVNMSALRQARLSEQINRLHLKSTISDTIAQIIAAYYQLLEAREQLGIAKDSLQRSVDLQAVNRALIAAGRMAESEMVQAESGVASQELAVVSAENAFESARLALLVLLAVDPHTRLVPAELFKTEPVKLDLDRMLTIAFDNRPDYLTQLITIEVARLAAADATNGRLWDLSLAAGASIPAEGSNARLAVGALAATKPEFNAGLQLTIPLNSLTPEQAEVQARVALQQNELGMEQLRSQIEQEVRDAVRAVGVGWRQAKLAAQVHALARKTLEIEQIKLKAGRSTNFEIVSFQRDLVTAESAELTAGIAYLSSLVTLDQQLGTTLDTWKIQINDKTP